MVARYLGSQRPDADGCLVIGGVRADQLAETYGTPLYVLDASELKARCAEFLAAIEPFGGRCAYASKANSAVALLRLIREQGCDVDVASEGELEAALRAGFAPAQIHLHGNAKSDSELRRAVAEGIGAVVLDSLSEVERLDQVCRDQGETQRVLLRLAPGVDSSTHEAIRTGQEDSKFGLNISSGAAAEALERVLTKERLRWAGVHCHVGSQLLDGEAIVEGARRCAQFLTQVRSQAGDAEELIAGGGFGIPYTAEDRPTPVSEVLAAVYEAVREVFESAAAPVPRIGFEPGRWLVGTAGVNLYRVIVKKEVPIPAAPSKRTYLSVDGGMADNPRPQLYGARYTVLNASRLLDEHDTPFRIAGRHCETDTLEPEAYLPASTTEGDLLAFQCTGAYTQSMASNYNRYPRPPLVCVEDGRAYLMVRRERLDELFQCEMEALPCP
jgi:diaminopimelate decarboxylase